jgi:hypothetical protein
MSDIQKELTGDQVNLQQDAFKKAKNAVIKLQQDYINIFDEDSPVVENILNDLKIFCRANESTFNADPRIHAMLEGRREVWLHIERQLKLKPDELVARVIRTS